MEDIKPLIGIAGRKLKQASFLWAEGFREACCLHRVIVLCLRSKKLSIRTGQCFLLNGFIFLGSLFVLNSVVIPILQWLLPDHCSQINGEQVPEFHGVFKFYSFLRGLLIQLFYPMHTFTKTTFLTAVAISLCPALTLILELCTLLGCYNQHNQHKPTGITNVHLITTILVFACVATAVFWFYPLYLFSFILSNLWYNDIAKHGFSAMGRSRPSVVDSSKQNDILTSDSEVDASRPAGLGGIMIGIGEQVYSVLLLSFFFLEVYATGFIPYVGKALNFILLSWMYAYYCFEYKWNFSEWGLAKRLKFFETNWAFFAGFGSPCVLAIFFFSPLVSYGVMAILFPLFVLTATGTEAEQVISTQRRRWSGAELGKLPVFYAVDNLLMRVLSHFPLESREQEQDNRTQ